MKAFVNLFPALQGTLLFCFKEAPVMWHRGRATHRHCQHGVCNILAKASLVVKMRQDSIIRNTKRNFPSSPLEAGSKLSSSLALQLPACVVPRSKRGDVHVQDTKKVFPHTDLVK